MPERKIPETRITMSNTLDRVLVLAPAKVNWTLDVLAKRSDGYHDIESVMQTVSLPDYVILSRRDAPGIGLTVAGPMAAGVPTDSSNLAHRAAGLILNAAGCPSHGIHIDLTKLIPSQSGLGGGSSDAASVLLGINRLLGEPFTTHDLLPIAKELGADVSFFLYGGTCRVRGIGEVVEPIESGPRASFVIIKPRFGVSTKEAYRALDESLGRESARSTREWPDGGLSNDFEAVVFEMTPELKTTRQALFDAGATKVLLCGSGSCLAAFTPEPMALWETLRRQDAGDVWVVRPWYDDPQGRIRQRWS